ncbi:gephyrin-like molybdotransferase Glp [Albirhodobacter sp. R86504]|uniref:molybdopterin molybdotransferase MoeA n=1 Tax=Albirhodobacter sp. R86504 TaxID=3093848 RepID=UPI0036720B9D
MISVEEARARVLALAKPLAGELVPLRHARGRVMVTDAIARLTQPPFAASAMDGYWLAASDHQPGARLDVIGEAGAGHPFSGDVPAGACIRIFTGAPVPTSGGVVVLQETVTRAGETITLAQQLSANDNIRPEGQDFRQGDTLRAPRVLTPRDIGLLAAMNVAQVEVARRPVVAVIATGDELVMPGETPAEGQIICSNSYALAAMIEANGAEARILPIARDSEASLRLVFDLAKTADLIVTSGGASVGDHDLVGKVAADLGLERAFWKIAMRPGKPLMAGQIDGVPMLGLPGNPVSALVCAELFLKPLLGVMLGVDLSPVPMTATLGEDVGPTGPRTHYMRAQVSAGVIRPYRNQDSALLGIMTEANALLIREKDDVAREAGETLHYLPL